MSTGFAGSPRGIRPSPPAQSRETPKLRVGVDLSQMGSLRKYHLLAAVGMPSNVVLQ